MLAAMLADPLTHKPPPCFFASSPALSALPEEDVLAPGMCPFFPFICERTSTNLKIVLTLLLREPASIYFSSRSRHYSSLHPPRPIAFKVLESILSKKRTTFFCVAIVYRNQ